MKRVMKILMSLALMLLTVSKVAMAQSTVTFDQLLAGIEEANSQLISHAAKGTINLKVDGATDDEDVAVDLAVDYKLDADSMAFAGVMEVGIQVAPGQTMTLPVTVTLLDGVVHVDSGFDQQTFDVSSELSSFLSQYEQVQGNIFNEANLQQLPEDVYLIEETDTTYRLSINPEFDLESYLQDMDFDELMAEYVTQVAEQADEELSNEDLGAIEMVNWSRLIADLLQSMTNFELTYDKETFYLNSLVVRGVVDAATLQESAIGTSAFLEEDNDFTVEFSIDLQFSQHGEAFQISLPEATSQMAIPGLEVLDQLDDIDGLEDLEDLADLEDLEDLEEVSR